MASVLSIAIPPFVAVVVVLALTTQFIAHGFRNAPWSWSAFGCHLFGIAIETVFLLFLFSLQRWVTLDVVFLLLYALLGLKVLLCLWCWWKHHRVIVYAAWIWLVQYVLASGSLWFLVTSDSTQLVLLLHMSILVYLALLHVTYRVSLSDVWSPAKRRYQRDAPARW